MVAEERFLEPKLSLRQLAQEMDCHANFLSYQINSGIGLNFKEYLNGYRLKRFQEIAAVPVGFEDFVIVDTELGIDGARPEADHQR